MQDDPATSGILSRYPTKSVWNGPVLWGLGLPILLFLVQVITLWGFTIDDVAISYRYALHVAEGSGLTWNPGTAPVEGYSNFLWVLILAGAKWIGFDIETAAVSLGALLGILTLCLSYLLCRKLWAPQRFWWLPVLLVALTPEWVLWIISGLEIALFGFFLLLSLEGLSNTGTRSRRNWLLSVGLSGLTLTRPEGVALSILVLTSGMLAEPGYTLKRIKAYAVPLIAVLGSALGLLIFRLVYFGSPLPNTVYAKFSWSLPSLGPVFQWLIFGIPFLLAWGVALLGWNNLRYPWTLAAALALVVGQMLVVLPVIPVMYFLHRYQIAFLPLLVLPVPFLLERIPNWKRWGIPLAVAVMIVWSLKEWPQPCVWFQNEKYWKQTRREVADCLSVLPRSATVALIDAGFIPYWTDLPVLDVWGLCDRRAAHEGFSAAATLERNPEVYVMTVRTGADGLPFPLQGRDKMIVNSPEFFEKYHLWKMCGKPRETADHPDDRYAIFLNEAWARAQGITKPSQP